MTGAPQSHVVRPAGAGPETLYVLILCGVILAASAAAVAFRAAPSAPVPIAEWQIDARLDLNAAEQGINADLRVAAEDIALALRDGTVPTPEDLATDFVPPFARDATTILRGGHVWSVIPDEAGFSAWFGRSASSDVAGSLLLRMATGNQNHSGDVRNVGISVWLNRSRSAAATGLSDEALISSGWREIVSRFDASVTREARP